MAWLFCQTHCCDITVLKVTMEQLALPCSEIRRTQSSSGIHRSSIVASQSASKNVFMVLTYVLVRHCSFEHCHHARHLYLSVGEIHPCTQNQHRASSMGGHPLWEDIGTPAQGSWILYILVGLTQLVTWVSLMLSWVRDLKWLTHFIYEYSQYIKYQCGSSRHTILVAALLIVLSSFLPLCILCVHFYLFVGTFLHRKVLVGVSPTP
jgi:hypothetical protein